MRNIKLSVIFTAVVCMLLYNCQIYAKQNAKKVDKIITTNDRIRSVMIYNNNQIVYEKYLRNTNKETLHEIASITKSITSCLIGIALKEGFIKSLDQKIIDYFPDHKKYNNDKLFEELTIKNLLSMNSGLNWNGSQYSEWFNSQNQTEYTLKEKFIFKPGEKFNYNDSACHLLSVILKKSTKMDVSEFADKYLFSKLGITDYKWDKDAQGNCFASTGLKLKTADLLKFGLFYLNNGNLNGNQIISEEFIIDSTSKKIKGDFPINADYCYLWWISNNKKIDKAYFGLGYGGQLVYIVPSKKAVIVITSEPDNANFINLDIIEDHILKYYNLLQN